MKIKKYAHELTEADLTHLRIAKKLDDLDKLKPKVIAGFVLFWLAWICAVVFSFIHYLM